ncbi:trimeric LpxA-like protein [Kockovaella imperatae]|uniref:Dynactin subunit 6 n=1 Tax=Kockovaella imperatae TaxID=4999 RepID=A0A1Y1UP09_9TREE|nr:trimeric LpxA-like protein [Kockovaella imperatae]ORX39773.1 trimeric LpxA-like protein [Kockovaella imperatae]
MSRPVAPVSKVTAHSTSLICQDIDIRGDVTVGAGSIIHPKASILAVGGPIVIGEGCLIEETAVIVNRWASDFRRKEVLSIGNRNVFMVGCRVEALSIGHSNSFQPKARVSGVHVSDHCVFGSGTVTLPSIPTGEQSSASETLPPYTSVHGSLSERTIWDGSGQEMEENVYAKHVDYLREILPKFNRMRVV